MAPKPVIISERTDPCALTVGGRTWSATVRRLTRSHRQQLRRESVSPQRNPLTGQDEDLFDNEKWSRNLCKNAVVGFQDLTPEILSMLVEPEELAAEGVPWPTPGEDGTIAFTPELALALWTHAESGNFEDPITRHTLRLLEIAQLRKEAERKN